METETKSLRRPSRKHQHHNLCARGIVDLQASPLVKVTKENKSHKQMRKDDIVHDADFAVDLADSKSTSDGMLCIFGDRTVVSISHADKKQTAVSHSSTEAEVVSSTCVEVVGCCE